MEKNYSILKKKAIHLRRQGRSYGDIARNLKVSKSTVSLWSRDITLSPEHRAKLYTKQIRVLSFGPNSQKERRAREIETILREARSEIRFPLSRQELLLMGAALYWGEGSKGNRSQITNSDPALILFMVRWIEKIVGVPTKKLRARLNIYPQQDDLLVKKFWSDLTGIPFENFGKSYVKPFSKGYKKNNLYYGTIRVEIPRSADICQRIFGWIFAVAEKVAPSVDSIERKWGSLRKIKRPVNL